MKCYNCNSPRLICDVDRDLYKCLDCGYEYPKQYFFISHSHKDIEKVRIVRNIIEETFFYEPILFYLKCLSNRDEVEDLIKREIFERIWFVYCNSENAASSTYVQFERQYIEELEKQGKKFNIITIELDKFDIWDSSCYDYIRSQIAYKIRKTKVFCSYYARDRELCMHLKSGLSKAGYSVWDATDMRGCTNWAETIESKIKEHSYHDGLFLCMISRESLRSSLLEHELKCAIQSGALVVPMVVLENKDDDSIIGTVTQKLSNLGITDNMLITTRNGDVVLDVINYIKSI